jgi:hypothetical protein
MVWIALFLVVVVPKCARFKLWCSQMRLAGNARQVLKLNLATHSAAQLIVSFLSMIVLLSNAKVLNFALHIVILVSVQEEELLLHLPHVVVRHALL